MKNGKSMTERVESGIEKGLSGMKWERVALLGLGGLGGYMLWRKRSTIMRFFSEKGISAPWLTKTVGDAVRSGVNKVSEVFDHSLGKQPTSSESRSESRIAS